MARETDGSKPKFLCGFDEQGWFAAPLPEAQHVRWPRGQRPGYRGISDIESAKQALKPREVLEADEKKQLKRRQRSRRSNKASKRQGEWFFLPQSSMTVDASKILHNEPINMGNKRSHMCAELYRDGGEEVWVSSHSPNGIVDEEYRKLDPKVRDKYRWERRVREATVYVRGAISAPDHATLHLECWHRVIPNTESKARHAPRVVFLD